MIGSSILLGPISVFPTLFITDTGAWPSLVKATAFYAVIAGSNPAASTSFLFNGFKGLGGVAKSAKAAVRKTVIASSSLVASTTFHRPCSSVALWLLLLHKR